MCINSYFLSIFPFVALKRIFEFLQRLLKVFKSTELLYKSSFYSVENSVENLLKIC